MEHFRHFKYNAPLNENSKMRYEKLSTYVESRTSAMSLLDSCKWHCIKEINLNKTERRAPAGLKAASG